MAQPQQNITLDAPGFQGINTEDSPISQDVQFARRANNAVIDNLGRIASRKGFTTNASEIDYSRVTVPFSTQDGHKVDMYSMADADGLRPIVVCAIEWFEGQTSLGTTYEVGIVEKSPSKVVLCSSPTTAPALTESQIVRFNDHLTGEGRYLVFNAYDALVVDPVTYTATSLFSDPNAVLPQDDDEGIYSATCDSTVACAAYGRVWMSGFQGDYQKIHYSSLLNATWWYDGKQFPDQSLNTGGIIDVSEYWPNGKDRIQAIVAHNNMLLVFGRESVLLYGNPQGDPAAIGGIFLQDAISSMGLVGRDAICSTGSDIYFLDDTGVRSLGRSIQEQSSPMGDVTLNVRQDITNDVYVVSDPYSVSLAFCPSESIVICNFAETSSAYVMDTRRPSATGGARVTTWTETPFWRVLENEGTVFMSGLNDERMLEYSSYVDGSGKPYLFTYESNALALGDLTKRKFPKRMDAALATAGGNVYVNLRWGFEGQLTYSKRIKAEGIPSAKYSDPASTGPFSYWGDAKFRLIGDTVVNRYFANLRGSGNAINLGLEATIEGGSLSIQLFNLQLLLGRTY